MKKKLVLFIGIPYLSFNLFLFLFNFFNGQIPRDALTVYMNSGVNPAYVVNDLLFYLYFLSYVFILISIYYLYHLKIRRSIIFGIVGTSFYLITVLNFMVIYPVFRDDSNYSSSESNQFLLIIFFLLFCSIINAIIIFLLRSEKKILAFEDEAIIKKTILDLGTKFTRLETREISEKSGYDSDSIVKVLNSMISRNEIYAEYFKTASTVSFDQRANIDEIDQLMAVFRSWEEEHYGKLENK